MLFNDINTIPLSKDAIADAYETHLNPKLDILDSVDIESDGSFKIYYSYDGENAYADYSSLFEFHSDLRKYGRNFHQEATLF